MNVTNSLNRFHSLIPLEVLMKFFTTRPVSRWLCLFAAFMLPVVATSQLQNPSPVGLGAAGNYVILAKTGISTTGTTTVVGNLGISPAAASFITGFSLILPAGGSYSTSSLVTGNVYAADYASPTPSNLTTAVTNMLTAYTDAAGRAPDSTNVGAGSIGGKTLGRGVYKWTTGISVLTDVTISGGPTDVWIFQTSGNITLANGAKVVLSGGAKASNIFWQVAGAVSMGTTSHFEGTILCQTQIALLTGASFNGKALAQTAVTLQANAIVDPSTATSVASASTPTGFSLSQNYPNPFNPSTKIQYSLQKAGMVSLKVYNLLGNEVSTLVNGRQEAGSYTVPFSAIGGSASGGNTSQLASGVYFYRLETGSFVSTKKLVLVK
jgi:hypothetical protein